MLKISPFCYFFGVHLSTSQPFCMFFLWDWKHILCNPFHALETQTIGCWTDGCRLLRNVKVLSPSPGLGLPRLGGPVPGSGHWNSLKQGDLIVITTCEDGYATFMCEYLKTIRKQATFRQKSRKDKKGSCPCTFLRGKGPVPGTYVLIGPVPVPFCELKQK